MYVCMYDSVRIFVINSLYIFYETKFALCPTCISPHSSPIMFCSSVCFIHISFILYKIKDFIGFYVPRRKLEENIKGHWARDEEGVA